jgi:hypothetical protein
MVPIRFGYDKDRLGYLSLSLKDDVIRLPQQLPELANPQ